jgi:hypothetical protein
MDLNYPVNPQMIKFRLIKLYTTKEKDVKIHPNEEKNHGRL